MKGLSVLAVVAVAAVVFFQTAAADYDDEVRGLGGKKIHDIVASAERCTAFKIAADAAQPGAFTILGDGRELDGEAQHMMTQHVGKAALLHHHPKKPALPDHLLRFSHRRGTV